MVRAVGQDTFQPKIGFKTRYGIVANPFAGGSAVRNGVLTANDNVYYRRVKVANLMWYQFTYFQDLPSGRSFFLSKYNYSPSVKNETYS